MCGVYVAWQDTAAWSTEFNGQQTDRDVTATSRSGPKHYTNGFTIIIIIIVCVSAVSVIGFNGICLSVHKRKKLQIGNLCSLVWACAMVNCWTELFFSEYWLQPLTLTAVHLSMFRQHFNLTCTPCMRHINRSHGILWLRVRVYETGALGRSLTHRQMLWELKLMALAGCLINSSALLLNPWNMEFCFLLIGMGAIPLENSTSINPISLRSLRQT